MQCSYYNKNTQTTARQWFLSPWNAQIISVNTSASVNPVHLVYLHQSPSHPLQLYLWLRRCSGQCLTPEHAWSEQYDHWLLWTHGHLPAGSVYETTKHETGDYHLQTLTFYNIYTHICVYLLIFSQNVKWNQMRFLPVRPCTTAVLGWERPELHTPGSVCCWPWSWPLWGPVLPLGYHSYWSEGELDSRNMFSVTLPYVYWYVYVISFREFTDCAWH